MSSARSRLVWLALCAASLAAATWIVGVRVPEHASADADAAAPLASARGASSEPVFDSALEPNLALEPAPLLTPEPLLAPLASADRRAADVPPPPGALRVLGRAVDRAGRPLRALDVVARVRDEDPPAREWSTQVYAVRARAPTDADGRFELWIESASYAQAYAVALRLACAGEEGFGGPSFTVVAPGADRAAGARSAEVGGHIDVGDVVLRAHERLLCSGRYELAEGGAVAARKVHSELHVDGLELALRRQDGDPGAEGALLLGNERGDFALYADRAGGTRFELVSQLADRPRPVPLAALVGVTGETVVFDAWASLRGVLLTDFGALQSGFKVVCRYDARALPGKPDAAQLSARIDERGRFELRALPAGFLTLHVESPRPGLDGGAIAELELRWGESRELGALDLRGVWAAARLEVRDARGQPASGWAVVEPGDRAPFGFVRELATALPRGTRKLHVYVPGHRVATVVWPPRSDVLELEEGPLLDLGFGACGPCCVGESGLDVELEPVAFDDANARHFAPVMRLLPLSCDRRASVRLPCAGTYRLNYRPQRRADVALLARSYDIAVPAAGRSFDP